MLCQICGSLYDPCMKLPNVPPPGCEIHGYQQRNSIKKGIYIFIKAVSLTNHIKKEGRLNM